MKNGKFIKMAMTMCCMLCISIIVTAQTSKIVGTIVDSNEEAIIGANIQVKGGSINK